MNRSASHVFPSEVLNLCMHVFLLFSKRQIHHISVPLQETVPSQEGKKAPKLEAELICRIITSLFEDKYQILYQSEIKSIPCLHMWISHFGLLINLPYQLSDFQ